MSSLRRGHAVSIQLDLCAPTSLLVSSLGRGHVSSNRHHSLLPPRASHISVSFKKNLTTLLRSYMPFLCRGHAAVSRINRHPCAGAMQHCPAEEKTSEMCKRRGSLLCLLRSAFSRNSHLRASSRGFHRFAPHEHHGRPFWRETWR